MRRAARPSLLLLIIGIAFVAPGRAAGEELQPGGATEEIYSQYTRRYPFRNSLLEWSNSLTAISLIKSAEQTWNPYYAWLFRFYPRYYFNDNFYVRAKLGLEIEWTNSDDTTTYREPRLEDLWLDAVYDSLLTDKKWTGIELTPSFRLVVPTSLEARARTLYLGIGPGFSLRRTFNLPKGMILGFSYGFRYIKNLNHYPTVQNEAPTISSCGGAGGEGDCGQFLHTGSRSPSHEFLNQVAVEYWPTAKIRTSVSVLFRNQLLYGLTPVTATPGGQPLSIPDDPQNGVNSTGSIWYVVDATYQIHPIVSVGFGISTLNPQRAPDGSLYAPFVNRYTEFVLTTGIALDNVVAGIEKRVRPRAGVIAHR